MRYLGGKARLAKRIAAIVDMNRVDGEPYWDLCCGAGNVLAAISPRGPRHAVDVVPCLVRLHREVRDGIFVPPAEATRETHAALRQRAMADPLCDDPLLAFYGFGLSFCGDWFCGYAESPDYDYLGAATRGLAKKREPFRGVEFLCVPWQSIVDRISGTVYIDPPYAGTTGYKAAPPHDPVAFWRDADALVERDAVRQVFVSEYKAPAHWTEIARWDRKKSINHGTCIERLFTRAKYQGGKVENGAEIARERAEAACSISDIVDGASKETPDEISVLESVPA